jgi:hypothetical protein
MIYLLILALNFSVHAADTAKTASSAPKTLEKAKAVVTEPVKNASQDKTEVVTGEVFDFDGKEKLFNYESERKVTGNSLNSVSRYKDLTGEIVAEEKAEIVNGELKSYHAERMPTREKGLIETRDGRIFFTYTERGKKSTKYEKLEPNTLVSASICPHLEAHWDELMAKKDLVFRYAVWYRQETVGFKLSFYKEQGDQVIFEMNPTNIFYRSLVNPLFFHYDKKARHLVELKGRTMPKIKKGSSWRDLDALIKYKYQ